MTELRYTIDASADVTKASEIFNLQRIRRLPVMENGEIVGMVTARDVAKFTVFWRMREAKIFSRRSSSIDED